MAVEKTEQIWLDGELIPWDDAQIHLLTHTLHYGLGAFEGIRCYECADQRSAVFRLREHLERLSDSARILEIDLPYDVEALERVVLDTLRINGMTEGYIRPLVFLGAGAMGLLPTDNPVHVAVIVWPWGAYLGEGSLETGIRAKVSSYSRHHVNSAMNKSKTCGDYVNSILAKREVTRLGYDEAIMLDTSGLVAEASGENLFMVRAGVLKTPPGAPGLEGITRDAVLTIARDKGIPFVEQQLTLDELYTADEAFLTGTAAEVTPVGQIGDYNFEVGAMCRDVSTAYEELVRA